MADPGGIGDGAPFDVAVVGGGIVGCAVARRFTLEGARVILLEKAPDILAGASKGNSGLLHTGFDAPPASLELACIRAGREEYLAIREQLKLPVLECGALLVAWTGPELPALPALLAQARAKGVDEVEPIDGAAIRRLAPHLAAGVQGGLLVPGECAIDPWSAALAYLRQAVGNGAVARFDAEVIGGAFSGKAWTLSTGGGPVAARTVVNCAGLFGDLLEERLLGQADFRIRPRKGQFVVFDKPAAALVRSIILPVPTEHTKGVVLAPTVFGNVLVGPTAEEQEDRSRAAVDEAALRRLIDRAAALVPALADVAVAACYAGLRPATERKEYRVRIDPARHWITAGGIRSTGLTAALGLAQHVWRLYAAAGRAHTPLADPYWPAMPNLAEHAPRDWQADGHGEIVCHCELVTRREIEAALSGPLPARGFGGLKRPTPAPVGRWPGLFCTRRLATLT